MRGDNNMAIIDFLGKILPYRCLRGTTFEDIHIFLEKKIKEGEFIEWALL